MRTATPNYSEGGSKLGDKAVVATIGVNDIDAARAFSEGRLGLKSSPSVEPGVLLYESGASKAIVYQSQVAGTNEATAATEIFSLL